MGTIKKSLAKKLPLLTLIFSLAAGSLLAITLGFQLNTISTEQQNHFGQALSTQLAKSVHDPMIQQDTLSMQVEVDETANTEGIKHAAVYDATNYLIVESQRSSNITKDKDVYRSSITIENAIAGYASVHLDQQFFAAPLKTLRLTFIFLWCVITAALVFVSIKVGKNLSNRLSQITQRLPGDTPDGMDELSSLEFRVEPLLATRDCKKKVVNTANKNYALLAMVCKNLPRLESLVNREHFESVMTQLDFLVNDAAALYGGTRLNADRFSIYLECTGEVENSDHPLRALYCATAIQSLSKQLLDKQGVQLELASAISHDELELSSSQLLNERILQEQVKILQNLLEKAVNGEILLNKKTSEHTALEDINISPLADDSPLFRVDKLHESGEQLVNQQLALLTRNL
jgi:uncharacterized membrane protein affecting hemolysin expression